METQSSNYLRPDEGALCRTSSRRRIWRRLQILRSAFRTTVVNAQCHRGHLVKKSAQSCSYPPDQNILLRKSINHATRNLHVKLVWISARRRFFHDIPTLLVKLDGLYEHFIRHSEKSESGASLVHNFPPPTLRRNIAMLCFLHKRFLGFVHSDMEEFCPLASPKVNPWDWVVLCRKTKKELQQVFTNEICRMCYDD